MPLEAYPRIFKVEMDGELFSRVLAVVREDSAFAPKWLAAVGALVERFDIEPYSDFSVKSSNFRRPVLRYIGNNLCK